MLQRGINRSALILLVINSTIGAGIFGLPSKLFGLAGVYSLLAFAVCALVVGVFVLCFAEVSTQFRDTGGPYLYAHTAFGPFAGFLVGWLLLLSRAFNYAVLINLLVTNLGFFSSVFTGVVVRGVVIATITLALAVLNYRGLKGSTRTSSVVTVAKLFPLMVFIVVGLFALKPEPFQAAVLPPMPAFSEAVLLLIFAFGGFESVLVNTGEISNPRKDLAFALFGGLGVVTVVYIAIHLVCIHSLPGLASSTRPVADAAVVLMGPGGGVMVAVGAAVSIVGTLNVLLLSGSRLPYAFAQQNQLPASFARVHPRFATPVISLAACTVLYLGVSLAWTFLTALTVAVVIRVLVYLSVCAALLRFRRLRKGAADHFRVRGGRWVALTGIAVSGWLLSAANSRERWQVAVCLLAGLLLYAGNRWRAANTRETGIKNEPDS